MALTDQEVLAALKKILYPGFTRDIVSAGAIRNVVVDQAHVRFEVVPGPGDPAVMRQIQEQARVAVETLPGVAAVEIMLAGTPTSSSALKMAGAKPSVAQAGALDSSLIPEVKTTIAVASGKGGVGKSTVAVNLATALARHGVHVGLLDADIYGPSIPLMMGRQHEQPRLIAGQRRMVPFERFGVQFMSLGFMVDPDSAVIWRGPMVMKAIVELLGNVTWGALDILVVDMPPGTGDAQLTLSQRVELAGAVIVTTPQDVALADAIKGVAMFRKVNVPVLGIVENMSYFLCPHCSGRTEIFDHGGGQEQASRLKVPFLGEIPLDPAIRSAGDAGQPIVASAPESTQAKTFLEIASKVRDVLHSDESSDRPSATDSIFRRFRKVWSGSKK
jgi:ATP-binding protein involved in chromosome partitioning